MRKFNLFLLSVVMLLAFQIPTARAQAPELTVDGKTNNGVKLQRLKIDVTVYGNVSRTTWQMTFYNSTSRILEGNLTFPLKDGINVSRYALDINGKMREAVPVDRGKGTVVFEAVERRRIDPGLLEKVEGGNTFRTRIYPINPNSTRTVIIGYEEEIPLSDKGDLKYGLPLGIKDTVADFSINAAVVQSIGAPVADNTDGSLVFDKHQNTWSASFSKKNFVPDHTLAFSIPRPQDASEVMIGQQGNKYYYFINTSLQAQTIAKPAPGVVGLLWDASLSGTNRDHVKEFALLNDYFKKLGNLRVNLLTFSNVVLKTKTYNIISGNWDELKTDLDRMTYDGATDFGKIDLSQYPADEYLLVSDGRQTYGASAIKLNHKPVYCINTSRTADYSNLKLISLKTGGEFINLLKEDSTKALNLLTTQQLKFIGIKSAGSVEEPYPSVQVSVGRTFSIAGITHDPNQTITLQYGFGGKVSYEKNVILDLAKNSVDDVDVARLWAQKKINELDIDYEANRQAIESLGKRFSIVTRNTSLIVLESLNDYIQYEIEPPAELRAEFDAIMKQRGEQAQRDERENLGASKQMMNDLARWSENPKKDRTTDTKTGTAVNSSTVVRNANNGAIQLSDAQAAPNTAASPGTPGAASNVANVPATAAHIISGRVTARDDGLPIPGATVKVRGTTNATVTNSVGNFNMRVPANAVIVVSFVGYESVQTAVGNRGTVDVALPTSANQLGEVVVTTSLGIKHSSTQLGYSVQTITPKELTQSNVTNVAQGLTGKVAGLATYTLDNGADPQVAINLRGNRSILGNNNALIVLDGVPVPGTMLSAINPSDIADVTVLKGAGAAALYGSEASNGAIILTTKRGNVNGGSSYSPPSTSANSTSANSTSASSTPERTNDAITINYKREEQEYIKQLKKTEQPERYTKYLDLRKEHAGDPVFYFNVASFFIETGDKELGMRILSNLTELNLGSYELHKMLGYKLKQAGDFEDEVLIFKKITDMRPLDPQSYRDYGLALEDAGEHQKALDVLYTAMTKSYTRDADNLYQGIQEIFLPEINRIISRNEGRLDISKISKDVIKPLPTDVRIVINWNMNNTDIDLWVTDPNGEKCYYSHPRTAIGGRISHDMTRGFGPEQFLLKNAIKGTYTIAINYYGDSQATIAGPTTVMAELYTHYGTPEEKRETIVLQMSKKAHGGVYIGDLDFK